MVKTTTRTILAILIVATATLFAFAQTAPPSSSAPVPQQTFSSPQEAVDALISATGNYDVPALLRIFGPDGKAFISSADPVQDKNSAEAFAVLARQKQSLSTDPAKPNRAILIIGDDEWPFPVPLVKVNSKWLFDSKAGRTEVLYRRIGANELDAIQVCKGYVEAQNEYASAVHDDSGINQYAQRIISTPGKQDGLYWTNADGTPGGPISEAVAKAIQEGYSVEKRSAFHGYYFKVLKGQGPAAHLGKLDYVIQGVMIGGFALIAAPAEYRVTGIKTFIVNQDGTVYQKDLGPNTLEIAKQISVYNPDKTWHPTDDEWPEVASSETSDSAPPNP